MNEDIRYSALNLCNRDNSLSLLFNLSDHKAQRFQAVFHRSIKNFHKKLMKKSKFQRHQREFTAFSIYIYIARKTVLFLFLLRKLIYFIHILQWLIKNIYGIHIIYNVCNQEISNDGHSGRYSTKTSGKEYGKLGVERQIRDVESKGQVVIDQRSLIRRKNRKR